jgi:hypothetical protein
LAIVAEPEAINFICESISEGRTLVDISRAWDVRFSELHAWVHDATIPARLEKYALALEARGMYYTEHVLGRLFTISDADLSMCYKGGQLLPMDEWPTDVRRALKTIETQINDEGHVTKKLQLTDPLRAMELLGKHVKMFSDKIDVSGSLSLEALVGASLKQP